MIFLPVREISSHCFICHFVMAVKDLSSLCLSHYHWNDNMPNSFLPCFQYLIKSLSGKVCWRGSLILSTNKEERRRGAWFQLNNIYLIVIIVKVYFWEKKKTVELHTYQPEDYWKCNSPINPHVPVIISSKLHIHAPVGGLFYNFPLGRALLVAAWEINL